MLFKNLDAACSILKNGGVILYPTQTLWALGCDATNLKAVEKIMALKKRKNKNGFVCIVDSLKMRDAYVENVPQLADDIIACSHKPTTIIYQKSINLPSIVCGEDQSIAIRITQNKISQALLKALKRPLISTSANTSGEKPPKQLSEVSEQISSNVDFIVSSDFVSSGKASSLIALKDNGEIKIIRP